MIRDTVREIVERSVAALVESGDLPSVEVPPFDIERPQNSEHGDYAANIAMKLAAAIKAQTQQKANPRALAETIATRIRETVELVPAYALISGVEVAGPGFINLRLDPHWLLDQTDTIIVSGNSLGTVDAGRGKRINLEFVSANPTGPVTVGNGRGAFIGDTLGSIMRAAGFSVTKEYYFNDAGGQIDKLGRSMEYYLLLALGETARAEQVYAALPDDRKKQARRSYGSADSDEAASDDDTTDQPESQPPADVALQDQPGRKEGYFGPFYEAVAERMAKENTAALLALPETERAREIGRAAAAEIMREIRDSMAKMRVEFDVWFNQASLEQTGELQESIEYLRSQGYTEERDGALWVKTTAFGDDFDRVIVRSTGEPTYFASDVAYMRNKFLRGHDRLIIVLGPDHHGYIGRLKAVAQMLGHSADDLHVLLYQNVTVKGQRMGKRLGNIITLDELYEDVGTDVTRFFYLMRANDTHLDFDLDLARKQTEDNPGLSVQYAHARVSGVFRKAEEQGIVAEEYERADIGVLANDPAGEVEYELRLIREMLRLEEVVERVALSLEPHHLTRYGMDLADAFHLFYDHCPALKQGVDIRPEVRLARLKLMRAAQSALARTLTLLGMVAPQRMERAEVTPGAE